MTNSMFRATLPLGLILVAGIASSQNPPHPSSTAGAHANSTSVTGSAHGVIVEGGQVWGLGPDYKAVFDRGGIEYTPALGNRAPHNMPLRFTLQSIRRGQTVLYEAGRYGPVACRHDGNTVWYPRGSSILERYEVRADGIEQSFVFHGPLPGSGDLVVRGRIDTELVAEDGESLDGLSFTFGDVGGVAFGAVTGIDASGRRAAGTLRRNGEYLDLVLPESLVAEATYPLVLDPLIGTVFLVGGTRERNGDADVAFDESTDFYIVVWERQFSAGDMDVMAQRVSLTGSMAGGIISVRISTNAVEHNPTVANVESTNRFLIAWQEGPSMYGPWDIACLSFAAWPSVGGPASIPVVIAGSSANETNPDAGGEATTAQNDALVVYQHDSGIYVVEVDVPSAGGTTGVPSVVGRSRIFGTLPLDRDPAISKSGGSAGIFVIAWVREIGADTDIVAGAIDRDRGHVRSQWPMTATSVDEHSPDVSSPSSSSGAYLLAYERDEGPASADRDVYCQLVGVNPANPVGVSTTPATQVGPRAGDDQKMPAVGYTGSKFLVAWTDEWQPRFLGYTIHLQAVADLAGTNAWLSPPTVCGPEIFLGGGAQVDTQPEIATRHSARASNPASLDWALITYSSAANTPPFDSEIRGQVYEAMGAGGTVTDIGGGCGAGGTAGVNGPMALGNPEFAFTLTGADPGATLALVPIAWSRPPIVCGPCQVVDGVITPWVQVSGGNAQYRLPMPCNPTFLGNTWEVQFIAMGTSTTPCPLVPGWAASNRVRATIGL